MIKTTTKMKDVYSTEFHSFNSIAFDDFIASAKAFVEKLEMMQLPKNSAVSMWIIEDNDTIVFDIHEIITVEREATLVEYERRKMQLERERDRTIAALAELAKDLEELKNA